MSRSSSGDSRVTSNNVLVDAFRSSIIDGCVGVETPAVKYEYVLSSPFFGEAQSWSEAFSSFKVGDDGLSGGLAGAGGGQACLGDCILSCGLGFAAWEMQVLLP